MDNGLDDPPANLIEHVSLPVLSDETMSEVTKVCTRCNKTKNISNFVAAHYAHRHTKMCASCRNKLNTPKARKQQAAWASKNPDKMKKTADDYANSKRGASNKIRKAAKAATPEKRVKGAKKMREKRKTPEYKEYRSTQHFKQLRKAEFDRMPPAAKLHHALLSKMCEMFKDSERESSTLIDFSGFVDRDDLMAHFESQFEDWMSWNNYGRNGWHIGHRIARSLYSGEKADVIRCWRKENLFPIHWQTNLSDGKKLPSAVDLEKMRASWPISWNDTLPTPAVRKQIESKPKKNSMTT